MGSSDGDRILKRRAGLLAAAMASASACTPQCNPLVCLSVAAPDAGSPPATPPADGGTPPPAGSADGEASQTLVGVARDGKAGAAILVDEVPVYVVGLDEWPEEWIGKRVEVTGRVVTRQGLPAKPTPMKTGIVGAYRVIEDATWKLAD